MPRRSFNVASNLQIKVFEAQDDDGLKLLFETKSVNRVVNPVWMQPIEIVPFATLASPRIMSPTDLYPTHPCPTHPCSHT